MDLETRLKIKADSTEAKKLAQTIKQTFSPEQVEQFNKANQDLEKQFSSLTKRQVELTKVLVTVSKGTEEYKKLKDELKGVRDESLLVGRSLTQLDQVINRSKREQAHNDRVLVQQENAELQQQHQKRQQLVADTRSGRGRNLAAGFAQGLGIAPYIPTEPGMGYRIGGAMAGGMVRRMGRMVGAPFMTPGIGGVAQGIGGIPGVGGFGAGALQTAAAAYQSAVGFDRQRLANLYYMGPQAGQPVNIGIGQDARKRLQETTSENRKALWRLGEAQREMGPLALKAGKGQQVVPTQMSAIESVSMGGPIGGPMGGRGFVPKRLSLTEQKEQLDLAKAADIKAARQEVKETQTEMLKAVDAAKDRTGFKSGLGAIGLGTQFGLGPSQVTQMQSAFMRQRGGTYDPTGQNQFMQGLLGQSRFGISQEQAGGFFRGMQPGGGGMGQQNLIQTLQNAFVQGLRGAQIPEYLQEMVSLTRQAEQQGMTFDRDAFVRQTMALRQTGVQGPQLARIGGGLQRAAMGVGMRGVQGPMDLVMARAAGYDAEQGPQSYARAMLRLTGAKVGGEGREDIINNLLQSVSAGAGGVGGSPEEKALFTMRALGQMGVPVGGDLAQKLFAGYQEGTPDISGLLEKGRAQGGIAGAMGETQRRIQLGAPTAPAAAEIETLRISLGRSATWVKDFEKNAMLTAKTANNFSVELGNLTKAVEGVVKKINSLTTGGFTGMMNRAFDALTGGQ